MIEKNISYSGGTFKINYQVTGDCHGKVNFNLPPTSWITSVGSSFDNVNSSGVCEFNVLENYGNSDDRGCNINSIFTRSDGKVLTCDTRTINVIQDGCVGEFKTISTKTLSSYGYSNETLIFFTTYPCVYGIDIISADTYDWISNIRFEGNLVKGDLARNYFGERTAIFHLTGMTYDPTSSAEVPFSSSTITVSQKGYGCDCDAIESYGYINKIPNSGGIEVPVGTYWTSSGCPFTDITFSAYTDSSGTILADWISNISYIETSDYDDIVCDVQPNNTIQEREAYIAVKANLREEPCESRFKIVQDSKCEIVISNNGDGSSSGGTVQFYVN